MLFRSLTSDHDKNRSSSHKTRINCTAFRKGTDKIFRLFVPPILIGERVAPYPLKILFDNMLL